MLSKLSSRRPRVGSPPLPHQSPPPNISLAPINFDPTNTSLILNRCAVLMVENAELKASNEKLDAENAAIKFHNTQISSKLEDLEPQVHHLKQERLRNRGKLAEKEDRIKRLLAVLEGKKAQVERKDEENRELKRVMVRMGATIDRLDSENKALEEAREKMESRQFDREDNVKTWRERARVLGREVEKLREREEKGMKEWKEKAILSSNENSPAGSFSLSRSPTPSPPSSLELASPSSNAGSPILPPNVSNTCMETNHSGIVMSDDEKKSSEKWRERAIANDNSSPSPTSSNESNDSGISIHYSHYDLDRASQEKMERSCAKSASPPATKLTKGSRTAVDMGTFAQDFIHGLVFPESDLLDAASEELFAPMNLSGGPEDTWDGTIRGEEFEPPLMFDLLNVSDPVAEGQPFDTDTLIAGPIDTWAGILRDYIEPSMEPMIPSPPNIASPISDFDLAHPIAHIGTEEEKPTPPMESTIPAPLGVPAPIPDFYQAHPIDHSGTLPISIVKWAAQKGVKLPKPAHSASDEVIAERMAQQARLAAEATRLGLLGGEFISAMELESDSEPEDDQRSDAEEVGDRITQSRGLNAGFT